MNSSVFQEMVRLNREREETEKLLRDSPKYMVWVFNCDRYGKQECNFIFVEGKSDAFFYQHALKEYKEAIFISGEQNSEEESRGRTSVIESMIQISRKKEFSRDFHRCRFIVDRDYDPAVSLTGYLVTDEERTNLKITAGHSLENYLFDGNNMHVVFTQLSNELIRTVDEGTVIDALKQFSIKYGKYFAASATITKAINYYGKDKYKKKYRTEEIFINVFPDNVVDIRRFRSEQERMEKYIYNNELEKTFDEYKRELKSNHSHLGFYRYAAISS